jgi:hypothetical protein
VTDRVEIRNYRRVFNIDRRIYRVDKWALPVPGGVPLTGLAYFGGALLAVVILGHLPILNVLFGLLSPPLRYVLLPLGFAMLARQATPDGRPAGLFAWAWLVLRWTNWRQDQHADTAWTGKVRARWDHDAPTLRKCRVKGPAVVEFRQPVVLNDRWNGWWAEGDPQGESRPVQVRSDQTLKVRP